ncbi:MAG: hypothetical protein U0Q16_23530 [Bryobacteraceae bacterium]
MKIWVTGLNHSTAPVEVRERLAFKAENLPDVLTRSGRFGREGDDGRFQRHV